MKFTLSWLKDHLETTATLHEIAERLVNLGLEVEGFEDPAEKLKGFVVADVVEAGRHPNADRLSLCFANAGDGKRIQVVCGARNVRTGMKVAFAPEGVIIPSTGTILKRGKIRDVESFGMFCSATELGMGEESEGILDLDTTLPAGTPLAEALGLSDPIIDVSITPNRGDCFGIRGIARDLAASGLGTLKPLVYKNQPKAFPCPTTVTIEDSKACADFGGLVVRGVKNGPSPDWVQHRLKAVGLRPISALVDMTNYLTFDIGRPLHVFDLNKVKGNLTIRLAKAGETLTGLNSKDYTLDETMTVIADDSGVLSLGGIIGGMSSGCLEDTVDVLIECALFDPIRTALTGRNLSIITDARTRFERGMDPTSIPQGLEAAADLVVQWCGGTVSELTFATHKNPVPKQKPPTYTLTHEKLLSLGGCDIPLTQAKSYLEALGFVTVSSTSSELTVVPPPYRLDIEGPADLVEEVLRLHGYDKIPLTPLPPPALTLEQISIPSIVKRVLASRGLNEAITWSFMDELLAEKFGKIDPSLRLSNPISIEMGFMRPSIIPNLIQAAIRNHDRGQGSVALFEVGPQFNEGAQVLAATGLLSGQTGPRHWAQPPRAVDIYDAKAHAFAVLATLGVTESSTQVEATGPDYYHPGRKGVIKQGNRVLALFGEVHPGIINDLAGDGAFAGFEIFLDQLPPLRLKKSPLQLSPYQSVVRDFAFVVDDAILAEQIVKAVGKADRTFISAIHIFDVYKGDKLEKGKKSLAIQVRLEPQSGTLTDAQITEVCDKIVSTVFQATGGVLRSL
ncbi:MAG: phenylalanine--tRNA ligase subunit beta [Alphaproteobacteria bacterium]|jgi:phenylalanyl-tRNA synthetase beta chain|nr:phenylalanine--tRNA ligase subunit beta [Alphaproteobacteria bacterium]